MKNYVSLLLILSLIGSSQALAGGVRDIGNGGETIVCKNTQGQILSIEMLDTYEGRVLNGHVLNLGPANLAFEQKLKLGLERILKRDPARGRRLINWNATFFKGVQWVNQPLPATPDVDPTLFPKNCKIEQIAIQTNNWANTDWYDYGAALRIYKPLWDVMTADQKATLVIHELVYHEALPSFLASAKPIRDYTSLVTTLDFEKLTDLQYVDLLKPLGVYDVDINKLNVVMPTSVPSNRGSGYANDYSQVDEKKDWRTENFYPSGRLKQAQLIADQDFTTVHQQVLPLRTRTEVSFYDKPGYLREGHLRKKTAFQTSIGTVMVEGQFELDENQELKSAFLADSQTFQIGPELKVTCRSNAEIAFENKQLRFCYASPKEQVLETSTYRLTPVNEGFIFFKDGHIDYETQPRYRQIVLAGTLQIYGDALKTNLVVTKLYNYSGYANEPVNVILANPAQVKLRNTTIRLENEIKIYNGNKLASFQPTHNFEYSSEGVKVPVANTYKCGTFSQEKKGSPVILDREGNLIQFTASRNGKYRGFNLKTGTYCYTTREEFKCYETCN